jgi:hypothetical protein
MVLLHQIVMRFHIIGMQWNAINGTDLPALRGIKMAYALRALVGIDLVNLNPHKNRIIRALGLTDVAIDALVGNQ